MPRQDRAPSRPAWRSRVLAFMMPAFMMLYAINPWSRNMPMPRRLLVFLRSLLALVLAIAAIPVVNLGGAWLSDHAFGLPPGGTLRLAVDLFWVFMAGFAGAWLMVKTAAIGETIHAWVLFAIYFVAVLYGTITMWDEFPRWFTIGLIALLPMQVWLGWWLAWGRSRRKTLAG